MKSSIATLCPAFNMQRVVKEYAADFYAIAHARFESLIADNACRARALAAWQSRIAAQWGEVRVEKVEGSVAGELAVGDHLDARAWVRLGALVPEEVAVELYVGRLNADGEFADALALPMKAVRNNGDLWLFEANTVPCRKSGTHGYTVRVMPFHADDSRSMSPGMIAWA
jgi:starch phosphorylase